MDIDDIVQLTEARQGVYSDWHPPLMALIWHFVERIIPGPFGMLMVEAGLIWLGTYLVVLYWFSRRKPMLFSLTPILIVFYPPIFCLIGRLDKDNLMWAFLMLALGISGTLEPLAQVRRRWWGYTKLALAASMLLLALLIRHNALFAAVPIMSLCIALCTRKRKPLFRVAISSVLGFVICSCLQLGAGLVTELLSSYKTNVWASVVIYDIAGIIYRMPDHEQQQRAYLGVPAGIRGSVTVDTLLQTYSPIHWMTMVENRHLGEILQSGEPLDQKTEKLPFVLTGAGLKLSDTEKSRLLWLWGSLVTQYPFEWLSHKITVFRHVIGFDHQPLWSIVFMEANDQDWSMKIYGHPSVDLSMIQEHVRSFLYHLESLAPIIYRPWLYVLLSLLIAGISLVGFTEERLNVLFIAASGLANEAGLFLLAAAPEYRYSHYMIYTSLLSSLLFLRPYINFSVSGFSRGESRTFTKFLPQWLSSG